jgi:quinohemoprotein ethanol dehydrogenase
MASTATLKYRFLVVGSLAVGMLTACGPGTGSQGPAERLAYVDEARIMASSDHEWPSHGRGYDEQRYSPLAQITTDNVADLGLAWWWDTQTTRGLQATPIVVDGVMFTTSSWSVVQAHDARTGELLWRYDPEVPREWGAFACCDVVNRGVAVWRGMVFVGALDGRLIALDARNGRVAWSVQTTPEDQPYTITGAPRVVRDKVIIGNGGGEYGVRGYVTAYAADSGDQVWRFYTVPGNPDQPQDGAHLLRALPTWSGEWWTAGGGGTVWDAMAYDPALALLYVGIGNGSPWNQALRSPAGGDNLYLSSIVALDPDTGSLQWHYQTTPGDRWDFTATQHMILAELELDGRQVPVLMQAPKNGFFYVLDRRTGELISAQPYVPVTWASHVDVDTGRPVETSVADYSVSPQLTLPSPYGGHNWHPMSYSPDTGLVYIPALEIPFVFGPDKQFRYRTGRWNLGIDTSLLVPPAVLEDELAIRTMVKGHLSAWDPVGQQEVWRVQHAESWNGGVLTTAGDLVFQGRADGIFAAYRASSGELLWEYPVHNGIVAPPVTYKIDGVQYVSVMAGWGGIFAVASGIPPAAGNVIRDGRLLTFKLDGQEQLPAPPQVPAEIPAPPPLKASEEQIARGAEVFHAQCSVCHGIGAVSSGVLPDLRFVTADGHEQFHAVVLGGLYRDRGMPGFADVLETGDSEALRSYIIHRAHVGRAERRLQDSSIEVEAYGNAATGAIP